MASIEEKLQELSITLPEQLTPIANYRSYLISDNNIFISGQLPLVGSDVQFVGKLGVEYSIEEGYKAARICGINILAQLKSALDGKLDRVKQCVKLTGFVNSTKDFKDHPKVINGCSDLLVDVLGDKGIHVREAVGVNSLPLGVAVEISAIFAL